MPGPVRDASFRTPNGEVFRYRVAAIIVREGRVLLATNARDDCFYAVGGGVQVMETAEAALQRELREETGWELEPGELTVIHENFFVEAATGKSWHELALYFRVAVPDDFEPRGESVTMDGVPEHLVWLSVDELDNITAYPTWLADELWEPHNDVRLITTIEDEGEAD